MFSRSRSQAVGPLASPLLSSPPSDAKSDDASSAQTVYPRNGRTDGVVLPAVGVSDSRGMPAVGFSPSALRRDYVYPSRDARVKAKNRGTRASLPDWRGERDTSRTAPNA